jgi:phage-related minor tail protein
MPQDDLRTTFAADDRDFDVFRDDLDRATKSAALLGRTLATAFDGLALKGKSLSDVMGTLALSLSQAALKAAFQPLQQNLTSIFQTTLGPGSGLFSGFARGSAFQSGLPIPFAQGGVIANPITFPLADGRTGLAGERGAEAILPLARGPDGRLGVASSGASASPSITINIAATDVESFRRSESQIAAVLARAVSLGQRNA